MALQHFLHVYLYTDFLHRPNGKTYTKSEYDKSKRFVIFRVICQCVKCENSNNAVFRIVCHKKIFYKKIFLSFL